MMRKDSRWSERARYSLYYTLLFAAVMGCMLLLFVQNGRSVVTTGDGYSQHYTALSYYGTWLRKIVRTFLSEGRLYIPEWDFSIGMGSDVVATLAYYVLGDPLTVFSVFVRPEHTEYLYLAIVVFRLWASGLAFILYALKRGNHGFGVPAGALAYVFHGYMMYVCFRQPFFTIPMVLVPLLLMAAETIYEGGRPTLFILLVCVSFLSNFYLSYVTVLCVVFYVILRFFERKCGGAKEFFRTMLRFLGYGLLGTAMSAVTLVPVLCAMRSSQRVGEGHHDYGLLYHIGYYRDLLTGLLSAEEIGAWRTYTYVGLAGLTLLGALVFLMKKELRRQHRVLTAALLTGTVLLCIPFFGDALNGFAYVCNRWVFLLCGAAAYALTCAWPSLVDSERGTVKRTGIPVLCVGLLYVILSVFGIGPSAAGYAGFAFLVVCWGLAALTAIRPGGERRRRLVSGLFIGCLCLNILTNWFFKYDPSQGDYLSYFMEAGSVNQQKEQDKANAAKELKKSRTASGSYNFMRYDVGSLETININGSMLLNTYGTGFYFSLENGYLSRHFVELGVLMTTPNHMAGTDARTMVGALMNVGMYLPRSEAHPIPYGYEKAENPSGILSYINQYPVPFGYTYSSQTTQKYYDACSSADKAEILMQAAVVEDGACSLPVTEPAVSSEEIPYRIEAEDGLVIQEDGSFLVLEDKGSVLLHFDKVGATELSVSVKDLSFQVSTERERVLKKDGEQAFAGLSGMERLRLRLQDKLADPEDLAVSSITAGIPSKSRTIRVLGEAYAFYWKQPEYVFSFGYVTEDVSRIRLTFRQPGIYRVGGISVVSQPMQEYESQTAALGEEHLENVAMDRDVITGSVTVTSPKLLCMSIPYAQGWQAEVDGQRARILRVNTAFSGIMLAPGSHEIRLTYHTTGLRAGGMISMAAWLCFLGGCICGTVRERRKKLEKTGGE
ncbi:MAG: YfhO family protein [Lachnospiraceae bacterium]|nr:YfhO family protein [Lachnospiraceae bacterium]